MFFATQKTQKTPQDVKRSKNTHTGKRRKKQKGSKRRGSIFFENIRKDKFLFSLITEMIKVMPAQLGPFLEEQTNQPGHCQDKDKTKPRRFLALPRGGRYNHS